MNLMIFSVLAEVAKAPWYEVANGIIGLIVGLAGLISAGIGVYFAVKNFIKTLKDKNAKEIWSMIIEMADVAMKEAEKSGQSGASKKQMVIDAVKASCKSAGVNVDEFLDQLSDYIDQTIAFVNEMKKQKQK